MYNVRTIFCTYWTFPYGLRGHGWVGFNGLTGIINKGITKYCRRILEILILIPDCYIFQYVRVDNYIFCESSF
jgi:hypothetical protein